MIELNTFLKLKGLAPTGGQAKMLIRSGVVTLNSVRETRNKKKLSIGDIIEVQGKKFTVQKEDIKD